MNERFSWLIKDLIGEEKGGNSLSALDICRQFVPGDDEGERVSASINAAFLIALSGGSHPLYNDAVQYLNNYGSHTKWGGAVHFYKEGLKLIDAEISDVYNNDSVFSEKIDRLSEKADLKSISSVFFPEGFSISGNRDKAVSDLRQKREISITQLNPSPINDPAGEILFTSNVLITVSSSSKEIDELDLSSDLKEKLKEVIKEEQSYWYDHPIQIGVAPEHNEMLYGLEGLDRAVAFEKERGTVGEDVKLTCILSVSVTHEGLQDIAKEYLEDELKKSDIRHLDIYIFTEADTKRLIDEILLPAAKRYLPDTEHHLLYDIFGVDGEYGRHYTFLKAVSAFWKVFIDLDVKGTFKIDFDQVFPQKELVEQSGSSAFEQLKTPLWGAEGIDSNGEEVELGMIAGALVNQDDIERSLYTPDVTFPEEDPKGDQAIFFSALPQALSTEAEMMTRYTDELDGKNKCIQRIHVTGGTNGILIDSLRRHRPFTPAFIGRAEDQAYILSVLFQEHDRHLRYVHKDGLIMRHDKEAFAADAIEAAAVGKLIGDYIRILYYSYYCRALPWSLEKIKNEIDPFTGCFVSKIPLTVVYLRFAFKLSSFFAEGNDWQGLEFLTTGMKRLHKTITLLEQEPNSLIERYQKEKDGWDIYYNILDAVEKGISSSDEFSLKLQKKAKAIISDCRITEVRPR